MEIIHCTMEHLEMAAAFYDEVTAYLAAHVNYPKWTPHVYPGRESTRQAIADGWQYLCMDGETVVGGFILNDDPQGGIRKRRLADPLAEWGISRHSHPCGIPCRLRSGHREIHGGLLHPPCTGTRIQSPAAGRCAGKPSGVQTV